MYSYNSCYSFHHNCWWGLWVFASNPAWLKTHLQHSGGKYLCAKWTTNNLVAHRSELSCSFYHMQPYVLLLKPLLHSFIYHHYSLDQCVDLIKSNGLHLVGHVIYSRNILANLKTLESGRLSKPSSGLQAFIIILYTFLHFMYILLILKSL